ncbi:MAG: DUF1540 domain-containing protein [Clostridia bacterium]|nr:DUF1540 domain-containing protein [Clostridia bacterium]MBR2160533.1 DUF1540 domain-containing protein [Clostridia bacterium]MBR2323268.1 DUF1540 domain-containing protein [Clostridia bacterium]MBR2397293.1 DUF1540 domain-containing protein [Clostridia bacterium]MBR2496118.1 DUF1540 domain-containing protein [Clostridia bacterium]
MNSKNWTCCVSSCIYNVDGCACSKDRINITNTTTKQTAHYCQDYEENI